MPDKSLATFRIEPEKWEAFKALATSNGSNASAVLIDFIETCLATNRIHIESSASTTNFNLDDINVLIDKRIKHHLSKVRFELEE